MSLTEISKEEKFYVEFIFHVFGPGCRIIGDFMLLHEALEFLSKKNPTQGFIHVKDSKIQIC